MGGILGGLQELLVGSAPSIKTSGAFTGLDTLGAATSDYLTNRLKTPAVKSPEYAMGAEAIKEMLSRVSTGARQRLGEGSVQGGWFDSGEKVGLGMDITRAEMESLAASLRDYILGLEDRRMEGVLPFLSAGANEALGVSTTNAQMEGQYDMMMMDFLATMMTGSKDASGATGLGMFL